MDILRKELVREHAKELRGIMKMFIFLGLYPLVLVLYISIFENVPQGVLVGYWLGSGFSFFIAGGVFHLIKQKEESLKQ